MWLRTSFAWYHQSYQYDRVHRDHSCQYDRVRRDESYQYDIIPVVGLKRPDMEAWLVVPHGKEVVQPSTDDDNDLYGENYHDDDDD